VDKLPLDYSRPDPRKPFSAAAIAAAVVCALALPVAVVSGLLESILPAPVFWLLRFLPPTASLITAIAAIVRIERAYDQHARTDTIRGAWLAYAVVLISILTALGLLAAPL
jgi:hypothetical protein